LLPRQKQPSDAVSFNLVG